jgi:ParB family chromosome partitioning protein
MQFKMISLASLTVTNSNMRHQKAAPDVADILPSIRERGILQPLLVRPKGDQFEIVAGRRRYYSACAIAKDKAAYEVPCVIDAEASDIEALEASLIENVARRDPSEMQAYATYARLIREGRTVEEIAATFGTDERTVEKRLALGNLLPAIRDLYDAEEISAEAVQTLTLANAKQQKEWLALYKKDKAPTHSRGLRHWLFGGDSIKTSVALFDLESYTGATVTDLFGDDTLFGDTEQFWTLQNAAIAAKADAYKAKGWAGVDVLSPGQHWHKFHHVHTKKKDGGKVFIAVGYDGSVSIHEGYLAQAEARKVQKRNEAKAAGESIDIEAPTSSRPEVTSSQNSYIELHRQAANRAALVNNPALAFRFLLAQLITGTDHSLRANAQRVEQYGDALSGSVKQQAPHRAFETARAEALDGLNMAGKGGITLTGRYGNTAEIYATLKGLSDIDAMKIAAVLVAECLEAGSRAGDMVGADLGADLAETWQADDLFFEQLRDKEVIGAMLAEVAGKDVADAHLTATGKVKKGIIRDCIEGKGRDKVKWLPAWLRSEIGTYTDRGGIRLAKTQNDAEFDDSEDAGDDFEE